MSPAVYLFTLWVKFSSMSSVLGLLFLAIGVPIILSSVAVDGKTADLLVNLVNGPTLAMAISYTFMQDNIANTRQMNDGEYLSLLFARPLTRSQYIMMLNILTFNTAQTLQGRNTVVDLNFWSMSDLILNALSYSALMVVIRSFPMRLGIAVFIILVYASLIGPALSFSMSSYEGAIPAVYMIFQALVFISNFLHHFVFPGIDLFEVLNTTRFSVLPLVTYVSNILMYLLLGTVLLSRREFSYGEE